MLVATNRCNISIANAINTLVIEKTLLSVSMSFFVFLVRVNQKAGDVAKDGLGEVNHCESEVDLFDFRCFEYG